MVKEEDATAVRCSRNAQFIMNRYAKLHGWSTAELIDQIAFTLKNGSASGDVLLTQKFPAGHHVMNIPDDGIIATEGVFVDAFTGTSNELTIILS